MFDDDDPPEAPYAAAPSRAIDRGRARAGVFSFIRNTRVTKPPTFARHCRHYGPDRNSSIPKSVSDARLVAALFSVYPVALTLGAGPGARYARAAPATAQGASLHLRAATRILVNWRRLLRF